ncbi:hypothetical protein Acr_00g0014330 [Actinidia rufa]|uniref:Uncharacterized protein n=1 Tax=Actinidia rufa TaxID=165716 RepID=A0A7J0DC45_9ERIC|nr:hypothetical protein Acr_00g0014330 [Actinidia rufa]
MRTPFLTEFWCLYSLFKNPKPDSGWLYFKVRLGRTITKGYPSNVKGWKRRFFFVSGDNWEFSSSISQEKGVPWVPRSWGTPGKHCNKLPILTDLEDRRLKRGQRSDLPSLIRSQAARAQVRVQARELCQNHGSPLSSDRMVEESKGVSSAIKSTHTAKGVVIGEKCPREEVLNILLSKAKSKGKEALPPPIAKKAKLATSSAPATKGAKPALAPGEGTSANPGNALGPRASMLGSALVSKKILSRVILPADKEKVDKLSFNIVGEKGYRRAQGKSDAMARLEEEVAKLKNNEVLAKKKVMEEYKSLDNFQEDVESVASKYFGEGFDFFKRQLVHHHPNFGIDLDGMGLDHDLLEEEDEAEEEEEEGDKEKEGNKERARRRMTLVPSLFGYLYFCKLFFSFSCNGDM